MHTTIENTVESIAPKALSQNNAGNRLELMNSVLKEVFRCVVSWNGRILLEQLKLKTTSRMKSKLMRMKRANLSLQQQSGSAQAKHSQNPSWAGCFIIRLPNPISDYHDVIGVQSEFAAFSIARDAL